MRSPSYESLHSLRNRTAADNVSSVSTVTSGGSVSLARSRSDPELGRSAAPKSLLSWTCELCNYENVHQGDCALCGTSRQIAKEAATIVTPPPSPLPRQLSLPTGISSNRSTDLNLPTLQSVGLDLDAPRTLMASTSEGSASSDQDKVAPLPKASIESLKGTVDMVSMKLLDISRNTDDHVFVGSSTSFGGASPVRIARPGVVPGGSSSQTLQTSNLSSSVTIPASNLSDGLGQKSDDNDVTMKELFSAGQAGIPAAPMMVGLKTKQRPQDTPEEQQNHPLNKRIQVQHDAPEDTSDLGDVEEAQAPRNPTYMPEKKYTPRRTKLYRLALILFVALIVMLSLVVIQDKPNNSVERGISVTEPPSQGPPTPMQASFGLEGAASNDRLGSTVAMTVDGTFVAAAGVSVERDVQILSRVGDAWQVHSSIPLGSNNAFLSSQALSMARVTDKELLVAVASTAAVQVFEYDGNDWELTMELQWQDPNGVRLSSVGQGAVALSRDGTTLAISHLDGRGENVVARVFNRIGDAWRQRGQPLTRIFEESSFLSISMSLSGSGKDLSLAAWGLTTPAVTVETFTWTDDEEWFLKGSAMELPWGPAVLSLSDSGHRLAVTAAIPGNTQVYHWDPKASEWIQVGRNLNGGSSVRLARDGSRVIVGNALSRSVRVFDEEGDDWTLRMPLTGSSGSQFGSSLAATKDGNILAVGAPLDKNNGDNAGIVLIFE